ncbi:MAG: exo-alpha-sialidase [Acidobacteria bacterium]|nr:exo-alpha-sialidase [Acidobacteriota bacterium]
MLPLALLLLAAAEIPAPPGVVIDHQPAATRKYIGSPSIAILPGGVYVASHDFFGPGSTQSTSAVTRVFRSTDRGRSWRQSAEMHDQFWSNLFFHRGRLYLMGTTFEYGRIVIRASSDGGITWTAPAYLTGDTGYHTAPVPMAIHGGRIWRAMEFHPRGPWGFFEAFVLSAPVKADLLDPRSWRFTERLRFPQDAAAGKHWLEGNAVVARDGTLLDILRVDNVEKAALLRVEGDRLAPGGFTDFPGGAKKFTIRYDRKSRRYWTLSNPAPDAPAPASVRNTLALASSADLRSWRVERIVLTNPDALKHGFQYVDWQFDGDDLAAAVRAAFDDDEGGAHNFHDANFLLFVRVPGFRKQGR